MDCHNFGFGTGYELFDADKKLIKSSFNEAKPEVAGECEIEVKDSRGDIKHKSVQPMHSFVRDFLSVVILNGRRFHPTATFIAGTYTPRSRVSIGSGNAPVTIGQSQIASGFEAPYSASEASWSVDSVTFETGFVQITVSMQFAFTGVPSTTTPIKEVAFHSYGTDGTNYKIMIAREVLSEPFVFAVNDIIKITWHLRFPETSTKLMSQNWINNFLGELLPNVTYKDTSGDSYNNAAAPSSNYWNTFCNMSTVMESRSEGLIVGSSAATCDYESNTWYRLGSKITNGTASGQLVWGTKYKTNVVTDTAANKAYFTIYREFTNRSGGTVFVNEAGITLNTIANPMGITNPGQHDFLLARWLTGPIDVQPNQTLRVYWQPTVVAS